MIENFDNNTNVENQEVQNGNDGFYHYTKGEQIKDDYFLNKQQYKVTFNTPVDTQKDEPLKEKKTKVVLACIASGLIGSVLTAGLVLGGLKVFGVLDSVPTPVQSELSKVEIVDETSDVTITAAKASESVVGITVTTVTSNPFFGEQTSGGTGSAVILRENGYIMTNYHVIADALDASGKVNSKAKIEVTLKDDKKYEAKVIGYDEKTDLAVVKVDVKGLTPIKFADSSKLVVGQTAIAIGNPGGEEFAGSVTKGIISGLNRTLDGEYYNIKVIQTDAAINPGNSGGALVNVNGELIGVCSSKIASVEFEGIGFAIPSNETKEIVESLITDRYVKGRPWLGITINGQYDAEMAKQYNYPEGALVASVTPFSGASEAGIQINDIITKFNGVRVKTFDELDAEKNKLKPGDTVDVEIFRDEKYVTVKITLSEEKNLIEEDDK